VRAARPVGRLLLELGRLGEIMQLLQMTGAGVELGGELLRVRRLAWVLVAEWLLRPWLGQPVVEQHWAERHRRFHELTAPLGQSYVAATTVLLTDPSSPQVVEDGCIVMAALMRAMEDTPRDVRKVMYEALIGPALPPTLQMVESLAAQVELGGWKTIGIAPMLPAVVGLVRAALCAMGPEVPSLLVQRAVMAFTRLYGTTNEGSGGSASQDGRSSTLRLMQLLVTHPGRSYDCLLQPILQMALDTSSGDGELAKALQPQVCLLVLEALRARARQLLAATASAECQQLAMRGLTMVASLLGSAGQRLEGGVQASPGEVRQVVQALTDLASTNSATSGLFACPAFMTLRSPLLVMLLDALVTRRCGSLREEYVGLLYKLSASELPSFYREVIPSYLQQHQQRPLPQHEAAILEGLDPTAQEEPVFMRHILAVVDDMRYYIGQAQAASSLMLAL
ncbi:hypothetical protein CYMTET_29641, partial [Cymbomonas tetramitiformis]